MPTILRPAVFRGVLALAVAGLAAACAPQNTNTTFTQGAIGAPAAVSYGTIVGMRPVNVQGRRSGVGTAAGAVAGGVAGSYIGGDWRANALGAIGGAVVGGIAGTAVEAGVTRGTMIEFTIDDDRGRRFSVVQSNEEGLRPGERVQISHGDRVRLARTAGPYAPPSPGYAVAPVGYGGALK